MRPILVAVLLGLTIVPAAAQTHLAAHPAARPAPAPKPAGPK
jgi:hypothetical protein